MSLILLSFLAACGGPDVQIQLPTDTGAAETGETGETGQGPFDEVVLVLEDSQVLEGTVNWLQGGDVDGDGVADVGFALGNRDLAWAKGVGEGGLEPESLLAEGLFISRLRAALGSDSIDEAMVFIQDVQLVDLDDDGQSEWLVTLSAQVEDERTLVTLVLSDPMGEATLELAGPPDHQAQPVSDLDGDGLPELVFFGGDCSVHTSSGEVWPLPDALAWNNYPKVAAMQMDDGEDLDLVVFVNGGFGISEIHTFYRDSSGLSIGPVNNEFFANQANISLTSQAEQEALLLAGDRVVRWTKEGLVDEIVEMVSIYSAVHGDLDGDGALDLLQAQGEVLLYGSNPEGPLTPVELVGLDVQLANGVVVDLDGDGRQDLVGTRWDAQSEEMMLESWLNRSGE